MSVVEESSWVSNRGVPVLRIAALTPAVVSEAGASTTAIPPSVPNVQ
jgi:hypothetical protein